MTSSVQAISKRIKTQLEHLDYPEDVVNSVCELIDQNLNQYLHDKFAVSGKLVITQYPLCSLRHPENSWIMTPGKSSLSGERCDVNPTSGNG